MPVSSQTTHGDEADSHLIQPPSPLSAILADSSVPTPPPSNRISQQMTAYRQRHTKKLYVYKQMQNSELALAE